MSEGQYVLMTAKQLGSALVRAVNLANGIAEADQGDRMIDLSKLHFHDDSTAQIVFNDVQAIKQLNALTGDNIPVPLVATEGYNAHGHSSPYDGGWIPGRGVHSHTSNFDGGFAFAILHPGSRVPQQPWSI